MKSVHGIWIHVLKLHCQRLGGDETKATLPASADVHAGSDDGVAAVNATE
jgi:hypothetical protein